MTTQYHTDIAYGAARNAATINTPLGQLDQAIANLVASGTFPIGVLTAQAAAGQKVLPMAGGTAPFANLVGLPVIIGDVGGTWETRNIASVQANVSITVDVNLTNTYAAGKLVVGSPAELAAARGGYASLDARLDATGGDAGTAFPGGPAAGQVFVRTDRGGAAYRYDGAAWRQTNVPGAIAFWGTPSTGDRCYRIDLGKFAQFDGTRWLNAAPTIIAFTAPATSVDYTLVLAATPNRAGGNDLWVERIDYMTQVQSTNDGTHYWHLQVQKSHGANVNAVVGAAVDTSADALATYCQHSVVVGALLGVADPALSIVCWKTSTPGALFFGATMYAREVLV